MFVWMFLFYFTRVFGYNNFASFSYLLALINYSFKSISSLSNDKYLRFYNSNLFNVSFIYFFIGWAMLSALNYFRDESILIDYILDSHNKIIFLYLITFIHKNDLSYLIKKEVLFFVTKWINSIKKQ